MLTEKAVFGRIKVIGSGRVLATCSVILNFAYRYHHFSAGPSGRAVLGVGLQLAEFVGSNRACCMDVCLL